jgi:carboxypeptidase Taq
MSIPSYQNYVEQLVKIQDIRSSIALLQWDMEIYAPSKGASKRAQQIATLSATAHEWSTSEYLGNLLIELNEKVDQLTEDQRINVQKSWESYQKETKLPTAFVKELSRAQSDAFQAWIKAREANDFSVFKDSLRQIVHLLRKKTKLLGYQQHPYDALLNEYEQGATVDFLDRLFAKVKLALKQLIIVLNKEGEATDNAFLKKSFSKSKQWDFGLYLLKQMGFDFEAGRQDLSEHPFTTSFSANDVRVTTRIEKNNLLEMIGGCVHEGGHALYEMGLNPAQYGLPLGQAVSLGMHESQSRLWENHVGLSRAFWQANYSTLQASFPEQLGQVSLEQFYKAINQIAPNYLRTIADEVHYHLHVFIRYEIEKGLIEGTIEVDTLEQIWNEKYRQFLGLEVDSAKVGILQDVHWAEGLFGYFPTYSLGSFYAAQFYKQASLEIPDLETKIASGNLKPLLRWLRENIHQHGQRFSSEDLCRKVTGEGLNVDYFMDYLKEKYAQVYAFNSTLSNKY